MKNKLVQNKVVVKKSTIHGYGVFAEKNIQPKEIIEECYTLICVKNETGLHDYAFQAGDPAKVAIVLGCGSIINHSSHPNAFYTYNSEHSLMEFRALRLIAKGEEIFISYGESWFNDRSYRIKHIPLFRRYWRALKGVPLRATLVVGSLFLITHFLA